MRINGLIAEGGIAMAIEIFSSLQDDYDPTLSIS
jgi:hypothetical protein